MDSLELLAREDEFKKLNKQLEKKTESLMKQIENAMQKQDIFSEFPHNLTIDKPINSLKKHCCPKPTSPISPINLTPTKTKTSSNIKKVKVKSDAEAAILSDTLDDSDRNVRISNHCCLHVNEKPNDMKQFLYDFVQLCAEEKVLPQSFMKGDVTVESVCKFLSSKVKLMQEQIDKLQYTIDKKASQCEKHMTRYAEMESERMTLLNKTNNLKAETADTRAKLMALQNRYNDRDRLYKELRSESDKMSSEVKRLRSKNAQLEARCASQEDSMDNMKQQVETAKQSEKELRDSIRSLAQAHQSTVTSYETKLRSITSRSNKQHQLINNLRKQITILTTDGAVKALEKEYRSYLTADL